MKTVHSNPNVTDNKEGEQIYDEQINEFAIGDGFQKPRQCIYHTQEYINALCTMYRKFANIDAPVETDYMMKFDPKKPESLYRSYINQEKNVARQRDGDVDKVIAIIFHTTSLPKEKVISVYHAYGVSPHYIIYPDGTPVRTVPDKFVALHAGKSASKFISPVDRNGSVPISINPVAIGIELVNEDYDKLTKKQEQAIPILIQYLKEVFPNIKYIGTHSNVSLGRRCDPGFLPNIQLQEICRELAPKLGVTVLPPKANSDAENIIIGGFQEIRLTGEIKNKNEITKLLLELGYMHSDIDSTKDLTKDLAEDLTEDDIKAAIYHYVNTYHHYLICKASEYYKMYQNTYKEWQNSGSGELYDTYFMKKVMSEQQGKIYNKI